MGAQLHGRQLSRGDALARSQQTFPRSHELRVPTNSRSCTRDRCWKRHFEAKRAGHEPAATENNRPNPTQHNPTWEDFKIHPQRWHRKLPTVITRSENPTEKQPTAAREDNSFVCVHKKESQALLPVPGIVSLSRGWAAAQPHRAWESGEGKCPCLTLQ